jgi:hypothetical protein
MGFNVSSITNNPYVQSVNQTVVSNLTSAAGGAVNNLVNNVMGSAGAAGGIISNISGALSAAGVSSGSLAGIVSGKLDSLITGASSYFASGSPARTTLNALANRNFAVSNGTNPESKISSSSNKTNGGTAYSYPPIPAPYYMMLNFYDYKRPTPFDNTTLPATGSVILPLPDGSGLNDNTSANWEGTALGIAGNVLDAFGSIDKLKTLGTAEAIKGQGGDAAIYALDQAASAFSSEAAGAAESQLGIAPNPAMSMLFKGVEFRSFSFKWTFAPKNEQESNILKDLIRFIKAKHLPTFTGTGTAGSSYLFNYPSICKPSFSLGQDYMTDFKYCVIKSVNVGYSPQGDAPSFYAKTKAPVFITLSIDLQEMQYRMADDYDPNAKGKTAASVVGSQLNSFADALKDTSKSGT